MEKVYEIALEFVREREETFRNAWETIKKIKEVSVEILKEARVYVFGSFARGDIIFILVISIF